MKFYTLLKILAREKHASLFFFNTSKEQESFFNWHQGHWVTVKWVIFALEFKNEFLFNFLFIFNSHCTKERLDSNPDLGIGISALHFASWLTI